MYSRLLNIGFQQKGNVYTHVTIPVTVQVLKEGKLLVTTPDDSYECNIDQLEEYLILYYEEDL